MRVQREMIEPALTDLWYGGITACPGEPHEICSKSKNPETPRGVRPGEVPFMERYGDRLSAEGYRLARLLDRAIIYTTFPVDA